MGTNTPVVTLEIELDKCGLNYGTGACTAREAGALGYAEQTRWDQGNSSSVGNAYYNASTQRLIVNETDRNGNDPDIFNLGWREIARYDIGNGTSARSARLLPGGGEVEVSNFVPATNSANPDVYSPQLPLLDDSNSIWRVRIFGNNQISNATSLTGNLDFRITSNTSARYRIGSSLTNLSSVFGTVGVNSGGGTMVIEKFNPATLTDGQWRIRRIHPTTAEEDVFSVGGMSITASGTQRFIRVGGATHAAIPEGGENITEIARWNVGSGAVANQADYNGPNARIRVSRTPLSGTVPLLGDGGHFYRLRRINVSGASVGTLTTQGAYTVFSAATTPTTITFEIGAAAGMTTGFGTANLNTVDGSQWILERGDIVEGQPAFTSPMTNFATNINSPEAGTNPAYMWALESFGLLSSTGETKCYNTFETCQDRENYTKEAPGRAFKFCTKGVLIEGFSPTIKESGTSHQPPAIKRDFDLWQREVVRVRIEDLPAPDSVLDDNYVLERPAAGGVRVVETPPVISFNEQARYQQGNPEGTDGDGKGYITLGGVDGDQAALVVSNTALPGGMTPTAGQIAGTWRLTRDLGGLPTVSLDGALTIVSSNDDRTVFRVSTKEDIANLFGDGVPIDSGTVQGFTFPNITADWDQGNADGITRRAYLEVEGANQGHLVANTVAKNGTTPTANAGVHRLTRSGGNAQGAPTGNNFFGTWNVGNCQSPNEVQVENSRVCFNRVPATGGTKTGSDLNISNAEWVDVGDTVTIRHTTESASTIINNIASYSTGGSATAGNANYSGNGFVSTNPNSALTGSFPTDLTLSYRLRRTDNSAMTPFGTLVIVGTFSNARQIRINNVATMQTAFGSSDITSGSVGWVLEQQIIIPAGTEETFTGSVKEVSGLGFGGSPGGSNYYGQWETRSTIGLTYVTIDALGNMDFSARASIPGPLLGSNYTIEGDEWLNVGDMATVRHTLPNGTFTDYTGTVSAVADPVVGSAFFGRVKFANQPPSSINSSNGTIDLWRGPVVLEAPVYDYGGSWTLRTDGYNVGANVGSGVNGSNAVLLNDVSNENVNRDTFFERFSTTEDTNVRVVAGEGAHFYEGRARLVVDGTNTTSLQFRSDPVITTPFFFSASWNVGNATIPNSGNADWHNEVNSTTTTSFQEQARWNVGSGNTNGTAAYRKQSITTTTPGSTTELARWNIGDSVFGGPGTGRGSYWWRYPITGVGGANLFELSNTPASGSFPSLSAPGTYHIRRSNNSSQNGQVYGPAFYIGTAGYNSIGGGDWNTLSGGANITGGGGQWILTRTTNSTTTTSLATPDGFCYIAPLSGSVPSNTSGTWRLELTGNSQLGNRSLTGNLSTYTSGGRTCLRVGSEAQMRATFGQPNTLLNSGGGQWILRRQVSTTTTTQENYFRYGGIQNGSIPAHPPSTIWKLSLRDNTSTLPGGSTGEIVGTLTSLGQLNGLNIFRIGTQAQMEATFGSGNDIKSGGGFWQLERQFTVSNPPPNGFGSSGSGIPTADVGNFDDFRIWIIRDGIPVETNPNVLAVDFENKPTTADNILSGKIDLWEGSAAFGIGPLLPSITLDGDLVVEGAGNTRRIRVGSTVDMNTAFAGASTTYEELVRWNVGDEALSGRAEWDDTAGTTYTEVASWTNKPYPGSGTNIEYGNYAGAQGVFCFSRNTQFSGTAPTTAPAGTYRLRWAPVAGSSYVIPAAAATGVIGSVVNFTPGQGATNQTCFSITSGAATQAAFGTTNSHNIGNFRWVLERQTSSGVAGKGFCYTSPLSGTVPTDTSGNFRLRLINNPPGQNNLPANATTTVTGPFTSTTGSGSIICFRIGNINDMRTAFGTGTNITAGNGQWILDRVTTTAATTSTNKTDEPQFIWTLRQGIFSTEDAEVINPPDYRYHLSKQEQTGGGSNLETTVAGSPGIITPESTYMKRWLERNKNYNRRPAKFSVGSIVDGNFVESFVSHLTVDEVDLDKKGETVTLILKDGIKLEATDGAVVPKPSNIQLGNDINDTIIGSGTTLNLIGNADEITELAINDRLNIDREVVRIISKSGTSVNVARGDDGSEVSDHDANTTVQLCYRKSGVNAADIYNELLNDFADTRGIQFARDEFDVIKNSYLGAFRLSANITKPVGVNTIIKEIQEATATTMYFDSTRQEFRLKSINGLNTGFNPDSIPITDDMIIENTGTIADRPRESLTRVLIYTGLRDATDFGKKSKDWKNVRAYIDETQESDNARGETKQKVMYNRWLSSTQASSVANNYLREGRVSTSEFVFDICLNPDGTVPFELGELYEYRGRLSANAWGAPELYPFRVLQVSIIDYRTARVLATRSSITPSAVTAFVIGRSRYDSADVLL